MVALHRNHADYVEIMTLFVLLVSTASAYNLTCHCLHNSACHSNGFCENGCELGWYGPGCQVGNVALGHPAQQSTSYAESNNFVYNASLAVDGILPIGNIATRCSHTAFVNSTGSSRATAWWVVTLDETHYYFITNITIVNRNDESRNRLSMFAILYSNTTEGDPDPRNYSTWYIYAKENGTFNNSRTYTSNSSVIAKRVAVYLTAFSDNPSATLTLCEVLIYGYEYYDCPHGFAGPGCLLRACGQCGSTDTQCKGTFNSCHYNVCPEQSLLPPDCWITLTDPSTLEVSSTSACNSVQFLFALPSTQPNIAASALQLQVTTSANQRLLENTTRSLTANNSVSYNLSGASAGTSYTMSVKLVYCNIPDRPCHLSTGIQSNVRTGVRQYMFSHNASCVFVEVTSTTTECESLSEIQITCDSEAPGVATVNSSSSSACGLERGKAYNCSVAAIVNANTSEIHSEHVLMELLSTLSVQTNDISVTAASISGSIIGVVVIAAITVVVYCRRKQNARFYGSAVKLEAKANDSNLASSIGVSSLPSLHKEQYDNPYESLNKDLQMQTTGDYASL